MITRYASAIVTGSATTFCLFFLMQALIALQPGAASDGVERGTLDFVRIAKPEEVISDDPEAIDRRIKDFPDTPVRPSDETGDRMPIRISPPAPPQPSGYKGGTVFRLTDGPLVAIVRVAPIYPKRAEHLGLEGWVLVEFDVRPDGGVANAFVVDSSNRIFDDSALKAVYRFRFKPRVVDGVPQLTAGLQNLFRYEISDR